MRWLKITATGAIGEMQSHATAGTLIGNWVNGGGNAGDVTEITGTEAEYKQAIKDSISLADYQTEAIKRLNAERAAHGYNIWSIEDQLNVNGGIESGNTTKARKNTFINAMKTEWGVVKTAINAASNELEVDAVTASWPTTPAP
ncbi:MAG: hypothetical protein Unbinned7913contig1002_31 [Prokaryotic dsDNA virus sp.]|jgi:hypothetical protein|nr:hypothetical protein [Parcubacteria group bacterium]QDP51276.1 MAG: hypothetical protein Unbinned7913contig1002_31 [Prokaryotic dsDNA virus sp.]